MCIINFEEHNGQSAKRRASDAQRKANCRNLSASEADKMQTPCGANAELERKKRREDKEQGKSKDLSSASLPTAPEPEPHDPLKHFHMTARPRLAHDCRKGGCCRKHGESGLWLKPALDR